MGWLWGGEGTYMDGMGRYGMVVMNNRIYTKYTRTAMGWIWDGENKYFIIWIG